MNRSRSVPPGGSTGPSKLQLSFQKLAIGAVAVAGGGSRGHSGGGQGGTGKGGGLATVLNTRGGAMIMKSVSIFLASGRRASAVSRDRSKSGGDRCAGKGGQDKDKERGRRESRRNKKILARMDELNGKLNPKMLEMYKRRTHFSK